MKAPLTINELKEYVMNDPDFILEYVEKIYDVISSIEPKVRAFITLRPREEVIRDAEAVIAKIKSRTAGYLVGCLIAVKDNIITKGIRTTCASRMLQDFVPPYNATVVERLREEDAIIIGKTNMDEFAMGSTTENSAFFSTRNPWDLTRVPGGSSGGSATAVAALEATASLGSDTGGSIRAPAAYTATVGLKPSYGLVSRFGLIAYANSLEQIGPICRSVSDVAVLLDVISGFDPRDSTSIKRGRQRGFYTACMERELESEIKVAIIREMFSDGIEAPVKTIFNSVLDKLESNGFHVEEVSVPELKYALPTYYIIATAEASSNLARYDGIRYGYHIVVEGRSWYDVYSDVRSTAFGDEVKRRILVGSFVLSAGYYDEYYLRASKVRRVIRDRLLRILSSFDVIASPTMPVLPPRFGERITDPLKLYAMDVNTVPANLSGLPAISLPAGFVGNLPVGFQLMSKMFSECELLTISKFIEDLLNIAPAIPELVRHHV
ncbi:MAG: Asp-tRNA(Asn)/Glu-tRNA(Gln) amidotransferase subunit GatA [Desulfurococcales archaeon]|nr:Asp-tRNA(Asn)/Glu-tRNA(Gln) amidotransferase subunit GatA [Desulfurococcales archaeon]